MHHLSFRLEDQDMQKTNTQSKTKVNQLDKSKSSVAPKKSISASSDSPTKTPITKKVTKTIATSANEKKTSSSTKATTQSNKITDAQSTFVKMKKSKIVRDSFTIPKDEYHDLQSLKIRCATFGLPVKKSELLRAGIKMLKLSSDPALKKAMSQIPLIKTGRPQKTS
jgi:hypothetical protein